MGADGQLCGEFLRARAGEGRELGPPSLEPASLEAELRERVAAGRAAWPGIELDTATFVRHLARHAVQQLPPPEHAADLWSACACAHHVEGAASAFERLHRATIQRAVRRIRRDAVDEGTQAVLVSLLVAEAGATPRIAEYAGRAALSTWLATVAANTTLNLHRRRDDQAHESLSGLAEDIVDAQPELALARARYRADLEASLREAFVALDGRQRLLLRARHVRGLQLDRIATIYRVSKATAGRMVAAAHEALAAETRRRLGARLKLSPEELESLVALLRSQLEVSLVRLLGADDTSST